ncbi:C-type lectin domain family 4 member G-like [Diabrotica virgifera virgifera]|uniref:C-type lectin domain-containing protein n=1 Tax=Diabrotica virgifera virgifera TaxID=50390 RepID=A0ABM5KHT1_DIAVI|nr:C-type lectin domain family 4 member G-like [Diabrotica virgifera virgifera]XP_050509746.1 C-type lectin domain family 4 member G-like [Diabrotica virgifera virgifera]
MLRLVEEPLLVLCVMWLVPISDACDQFQISKTGVSFVEAIQYCESNALQLVNIRDKEKNDAIAKFLLERSVVHPGEAIWTSGSKKTSDTTWRWLTGQEVTFTSWNTGEPNNKRGERTCISVYRSKSGVAVWDDVPCEANDIKYYPLCEKRICYL